MSTRRAERKASPLFELTRLLVRLDHVASRIVNANHSHWSNAICGGVNVGDAFRQVEGLVMVSGSESA
jgi:hypothetical protein